MAYENKNKLTLGPTANKEEVKRSSFNLKRFVICPARLELYLLCLSGFSICFLMRSAINLTILAMVKEKPVETYIINGSEGSCYKSDNDVIPDYKGTLDWSTDNQYFVLTSFYWSYVVLQVLSGILVQRFGTKVLLGYGIFTAGLCNLFVPIASNIHYILVVILQIVHGGSQGVVWSAIFGIISRWVPLQEKSRFTTCLQGVTVGSALSYLISGWIIVKIGWVYVFYVIGSTGKRILWPCLWYLLASDEPELHPRISLKELNYIQKNREKALHTQKTVPWKSILLSMPVWAIAIGSFGRLWFTSTIIIYGPLFLKTIGLRVEMNGMVTSLSYCCGFIASLIFSLISDKMIEHKTMSLLANRRLFHGIGQITVGMLSIAVGHLSCNTALITAVWSLIQIFLSSVVIAMTSNIVDISPNFTAPVSALINTILMSATFFSSLVAKLFLHTENTLDGWREIFYISGGVLLFTYFIYHICSSSDVQKWDVNNNGCQYSESESPNKDCVLQPIEHISNRNYQ
ncbi:hypothetical protein FQA39_LY07334 [Lamprigera yunnana]|nr:hypothetical protein FQA39_LY07334 [Lamprigera yunnana]